MAIANTLPFTVKPNGMALVTGWLANGPWNTCFDPVSTSWNACFSDPGTSWNLSVYDPPLAPAGGFIGLYRATSSYGSYTPPAITAKTSSGVQFSILFPGSFTNSGVTTFATVSPSASVGIGAVYADKNGTHFTTTSTVSSQIFTASSGTVAPFGMGTYNNPGGTLTKVSGVGDATIAYNGVSNTDFYTLSSAVAVIGDYTGNVAQNSVNKIIGTLADPAVVILDSQAMTGGQGVITNWSLLT